MKQKLLNKELAKMAASVAGATLATVGVAAQPTTVYENEGLKLVLDNGKNGDMRLLVENVSDKDMKDVVLTNNEIEGLKLSDKEIKVDEIKAGESKELEFKYELEKAIVEVIDQEKNKENKENKGENYIDTLNKEKEVEQTEKRQKVATSDNSTGNDVYKISVPITVLGTAGLLGIYAVKRKKQSNISAMSVLLGAGLLGASSMFGDVLATDNISDTGRFFSETPIRGTVEIEGETYDYFGNFYYETDRVEVVNEENVIPVGVDISYDETMLAGEFEISEEETKEGLELAKVTYLNGEVSDKEVLNTIEPINYKVTIGTMEPEVKEEVVEFETEYVADDYANVGTSFVRMEGVDGLKTTTYKAVTDGEKLELFKESVLNENPDASLLVEETVDLQEPVTKVIEVGTRDTKEEVLEYNTKYIADKTSMIGQDNETPVTKGVDGLKTTVFTQGVDPKTGELDGVVKVIDEEVLEPVDEVMEKGVLSNSVETVKKETIYRADTNMDISEDKKVVEEGNDGKVDRYYSHGIDENTGEILDEKVLEKEETLTLTMPKIVLVGAREEVEEVVEHKTNISEDANEWTSYRKVVTEGVDGLDKVIYNYIVESETGLLKDRTEVDRKTIKEDITELIIVGTKDHEWVDVTTKSEVIPFEVSLKPYITNLNDVDTIEEAEAAKDRFKNTKEDGTDYILVQKGEDGLKTVTQEMAVKEDGTPHEDYEPRNTKQSVVKEAKEEIREFDNIKIEDTVINHETRYVANTDKNKGEVTVEKEGIDGTKTVITLFNDKALTEKLGQSDVIRENQTTEVKSVGVKEMETKVLPFAKTVTEDASKWDNYSEITRKGVDGQNIITYTHDVDELTGVLSNKRIINEDITNPIDQITVVGTKAPEYKTIRDTEIIKSQAPVTFDYVSVETVKTWESESEFEQAKANFTQEASQKRMIDENTFVKKEAKDGEKGNVYKVAYDPELQTPIDSYEKEVIEVVDVKAEQAQHVTFDLVLGQTREKEKVYEYVANPELKAGETKVVKEAVAGIEQEIITDNGNGESFWVKSKDSNEVKGLIEVGSKKTETRVIEVTEEYTDYLYNDMEWNDWSRVSNEGAQGEAIVTTVYEVDSKTGELINPKEDVVVTKEVVRRRVVKGSLYRMDDQRTDLLDQARLFVDLVNKKRAELGLEPLIARQSDGSRYAWDKAQSAAQRIHDRFYQVGKFEHFTSMDNVMARFLSSSDTAAENALKLLMSSTSGHREILMSKSAKYISVGAVQNKSGQIFLNAQVAGWY